MPRNLAELANQLAQTLPVPPRGYLPGKTALRDALAALYPCSEVQAERLIEQLIGRGFLQYTGDPQEVDRGLAFWSIDPAAEDQP